jgi:hypothetical protein
VQADERYKRSTSTIPQPSNRVEYTPSTAKPPFLLSQWLSPCPGLVVAWVPLHETGGDRPFCQYILVWPFRMSCFPCPPFETGTFLRVSATFDLPPLFPSFTPFTEIVLASRQAQQRRRRPFDSRERFAQTVSRQDEVTLLPQGRIPRRHQRRFGLGFWRRTRPNAFPPVTPILQMATLRDGLSNIRLGFLQ